MPRLRVLDLEHGYCANAALEQGFESRGIVHLRLQGQQCSASAQVCGVICRGRFDGYRDVAVECFSAIGQSRSGGGIALVRVVDKGAGTTLNAYFDAVLAYDCGGFGRQRQTSVAYRRRNAECEVALARYCRLLLLLRCGLYHGCQGIN